MQTSVIILAGGSSTRMASETPKQFLSIRKNKMIVEESIDIFHGNPNIDEIILVCHENWIEKINGILNNICTIVPGGKTRTESSLKGLLSCNHSTAKVLIHDAARPYISQKLINNCLAHLDNYDASIPIVNCADSLVNTDDSQIKYLDRNSIKLIQTPQGFNYKKILNALENNSNNYSDDFSALLEYDKSLNYILFDGDKKNFKITTDDDLDLALKISNAI